MKTEFSQIEQQQIIDDYQNKTDIDIIIQKYDTQECYIRKILKDNQVDRHYNTWSTELYNRLLYLLKTFGFKKKFICDSLLISDRGYYKTLQRNNINLPIIGQAHMEHSRNSYYFDNIDSEEKAYYLGLLYSDGCNCVKEHRISIGLQERDKAVLDRFKNAIGYDGDLQYKDLSKFPNHQNCYVLRIADYHMSERLVELGVVENKSLVLTFPNFISDDLIFHFIRGLYDGDGCLYYNSKRNVYVVSISGTLQMCEAISDILEKYKIKTCIGHDKRCANNHNLMSTTTENAYKFLCLLYKNASVRMERKYNKYLEMCEKFNKQAA